jgi:phosphoribosyl-ATP pyrophosphohydrolase/phosphoribosyl-AMP cyclohydrolase
MRIEAMGIDTIDIATIDTLAWDKGDGLLPAIVQDAASGQVLMLAFMNRAALRQTLAEKRVTFYSRTKQRLWTKGETSGHFLELVSITADCDNDSLLVTATPHGPTCHTGTQSCFGDEVATGAADLAFLGKLEAVIAQRIAEKPEGSYTARLWSEGKTRMAQKVGEEGVEVALASVTQADDRLVSESADLLFHLALLLKSRGLSLTDVVGELARRHAAKK